MRTFLAFASEFFHQKKISSRHPKTVAQEMVPVSLVQVHLQWGFCSGGFKGWH